MKLEKILLVVVTVAIIDRISMQTVSILQSTPSNGNWFVQQPSVNFTNDPFNVKYTFDVNENGKYQVMDGFGGSLTDSSCWLIKYKLTSQKRTEVLEQLFSSKGINLNLLRQPIGATDFAWEAWSLADSNQDDWGLQSFSLWREDAYIWPVLSQALSISAGRMKIFASAWSPPAWMKNGRNLFGIVNNQQTTLRNECYDVYAWYLVRYIEENKKRGVDIFAITPLNEPLYTPPQYPGMYMLDVDQARFIRDFLGPKIIEHGLQTKILAYDHNMDYIYYAQIVLNDNKANKYIAGIGFHHYAGKHDAMTTIHNSYPNKDIWMTEAGSGTWLGGTTEQFQDQMKDAIRGPRNWAKGLILWNIALDQNGSPHLSGIGDSNRGFLVIRSDATDSVQYDTSYYSIGHSSKFVNPGAYRIDSNTYLNDIESVAYLNPDQSKVLIVSNRLEETKMIKIRWNSKSILYKVPPYAAITFKWN